MKKFVESLENNGFMKKLVNSAIATEKHTGTPIKQGEMELLLRLTMEKDEELEDIFFAGSTCNCNEFCLQICTEADC